MPSQKALELKKAEVTKITESLKNAVSGVIVDYKGITVAADTTLRKDFREAGVEYKVIKNTILRLAAKEAGFENWDSILEGTTALALSSTDVISPAKIAVEFSKKSKNSYEIKGGFFDGNDATIDEIKELAEIPSKEMLIAKMLGGLNAPIVGLAMTIKAIAEKMEDSASA